MDEIKTERIDILPETEDYMKESINYSLGLPVSTDTLHSKLRTSEEAQCRLRDQYFYILSKLKEKDQIIDRTRAEASMNAQAVKRCVEENQKLATQCMSLLSQCQKLEKECSLYDHDRDALMDFGNEADQRAKDVEIRFRDMEEKFRRTSDELQSYKHQYETNVASFNSKSTSFEDELLESILATLVSNNKVLSGHAFLEATSPHEPLQKLLKMWNSLKPVTQKVLSLVAEVKTLEKDREQLRVNLHKAEEEAELLYQENKVLDKANRRLARQYRKERNGSSGKHISSESVKTDKQKSRTRTCSPVKMIPFSDVDSAETSLQPSQSISPELTIIE